MFRRIALVLGLMFVTSGAFACPDLSGVYRTPDNSSFVIRFEQIKCELLKKTVNEISADGKTLEWPHFGTHEYPLDGRPICRGGNFCDYLFAESNAIVWKMNFMGPVTLPVHGKCKQNEFSMMKTIEGDMKTVFAVTDCEDGYTGLAERIYPRF